MSENPQIRIAAYKSDIIKELFVRTADQNYIAARWCAANGLDADFLWLAVHAIEKYQKAVLLINGFSSKGFGHNIVKLFDCVESIAAALFPAVLDKPARLQADLWIDRSPRAYIQHMYEMGNADNRYAIHGYFTWSQDLHLLDQMVFLIRRLIVKLDHPLVQQQNESAKSVLARIPTYLPNLHLPLDEIIRSVDEDHHLRAVLLNLNLPFAPSNYPHVAMQERFSSSEAVLSYRIFEPLGSPNRDIVSAGIELANWILEEIQLPQNVRSEIAEAVNKARSAHSLP